MYQEPDWESYSITDNVVNEGLFNDFNEMMKQREAQRLMKGKDFTITGQWDEDEGKLNLWVGDPEAGALRDEVFSGVELGAFLKGVLAAHDSPKGKGGSAELIAGMRPDDEDEARAFDAGADASFAAAAYFGK